MARNLGVPVTNTGDYYFLSYNSEDEARVGAFAKELHGHGFPLWYDGGIKVGVEWENEIAEKMENCRAVVMFLSKSIFEKDQSYVHKEYELATEYFDKTIYVVMLDNIPKREVPNQYKLWWIKITKLQCVNAFEFDSVVNCAEKLLESIGVEALSNTPQKTKGKIERENGDVYEGELVNGTPEGMGVLRFANGDTYEGEFRGGAKRGKGKYTFADGGVYEGGFLGGHPNGKGKMVYANGDVYEGDWVNSKCHGKGVMRYADGSVYEGDFAVDHCHGYGRYTDAYGRVFEGRFENGKFADGAPKMEVYPEEAHSNTLCEEDSASEKRTNVSDTDVPKERIVRIRYDGGVYEGGVRGGKPYGYGKMTYGNGDVYEGEWLYGQKSGKGKLTYANGDVYEGEWKDGWKIGHGKIAYVNGDAYEGEVLDRVPHGIGKYTWADGRVNIGKFMKGKFIG